MHSSIRFFYSRAGIVNFIVLIELKIIGKNLRASCLGGLPIPYVEEGIFCLLASESPVRVPQTISLLPSFYLCTLCPTSATFVIPTKRHNTFYKYLHYTLYYVKK